jgi:uncharacterized membrane protein YphA (DoxX/SURF4 family)
VNIQTGIKITEGISMGLFKRIFATQATWAVFALRFSLGVVFFLEGTKKLYGWFDGGRLGISADGSCRLHHLGFSRGG